jgi:hypothetical protein
MSNTVEIIGTQQVLVTETAVNVIELTVPAQAAVVEVVTAGPQGAGVPTGGNEGDLLKRSGAGTAWTDAPTVQSLQLKTTGGNADTAGELAWNADDQTLDVAKGGGTVLQVGQEMSFLVHNDTAGTINEGTGVMYAGTYGASGQLKVAPMLANGTLPGHVFLGVMTETVTAGNDGFVTTFGKVRGINTSAFPEGSILYCDPAVPGGFVTTEPDGPNLKLPVAAVIHSGNNGTIFVRAATGQFLKDCHDVETADAHQGDVLTWDDAQNRWEHRPSPPRSITIAGPQAGDAFTLFRTEGDASLSNVVGLVSGGSVTYELRYATDRTAAGTLATVSDTVTNTTTGDAATVQNQPMPPSSYVWVKITGVSGSVNEFNLSVAF